AAAAFENTGAGVYAGALFAIQQTEEYFPVAAGLTTVEARHAGFLNALLNQPLVPDFFPVDTSIPQSIALSHIDPFIHDLNGGTVPSFDPAVASDPNNFRIIDFLLLLEMVETAFYQVNVAKFFGENNLVPGTLGPMDGATRAIDTAIGRLVCAVDGQPQIAALPAGSPALAVFRPEAVGIGNGAGDGNRIAARIAQVAFGGASTMVNAAAIDQPQQVLKARLQSRPDGTALSQGETVAFTVPTSACRLVPA
ncbi:MAG: ferritin-like domain-containing protein, partial [Rhizobiales bacterium]|nr:ferritin-like domain-containing protein [Hyphomicrobiales bacterium]